MAEIGDGHRHSYKKPRYRLQKEDLRRRFLFFALYEKKRVPPQERFCFLCGCDEQRIRRYQRTHPSVFLTFPDALAGAKETAATLRERDKTGLNNYALIYGKGPYRIQYHWRQPCYGSLGYKNPGNHRYFVDRAGRHPKADKYLEYQEWCMTNSPYAMAFVNDHEHYLKTQCTIQDCTKMTASYIVGAAMQFRYLYEYPNIPRSWTDLVKYGIDPTIAFIAANWGSTNNGRYRPNQAGPISGHAIFDTKFRVEGLQNFLDHNPQTSNKIEEYTGYNNEPKTITKKFPTAVKSMAYRGLMNVWQPFPGEKSLVMPGNDVTMITDSLGRKKEQSGFKLSKRTAEEFHTEFIKLNGVVYEPKESIYRERGPGLCSDVPKCGVESSAA